MIKLNVALKERAYDIHIGHGLLQTRLLSESLAGRRALVLSDRTVATHYLPALLTSLGLGTDSAFIIEAGESSKTWDGAARVLDWMLGQRLGRDGVLIALGGGVVGDLAGFCAAVYQRGIAFVQLPTTLLAMVDSSVGGKTGVNHPRGKNLIGAIHQPSLVIADLAVLRSLPAREMAAGMAEVIKYGMLGDAALFAQLENGELEALLAQDGEVSTRIIGHCCAMKARIVAEDEHEAVSGGARALLNLGHTFGHAVETYTGYGEWLHGEAVGLGLSMAADLSARLGSISEDEAMRVEALVERAGLPTWPPAGMAPEDFRRLMAGDKKTLAGRLRLVLLKRLGEAQLSADFDQAQLDQTLAHFCTLPA